MFATMESEGTDMPSDVAPLIEGHTIREVDELADLPGLGENSDSEVEDVDCEVALRQGHLTLSRNISEREILRLQSVHVRAENLNQRDLDIEFVEVLDHEVEIRPDGMDQEKSVDGNCIVVQLGLGK
jgi:hypothetical protein